MNRTFRFSNNLTLLFCWMWLAIKDFDTEEIKHILEGMRSYNLTSIIYSGDN